MYQEMTIIGNVGKVKPAEKYTYLSVATKESFKKNDEWQEKTTWHNVMVYGKQAEGAEKKSPGDLVMVKGIINYKEDNSTCFVKASYVRTLSKKSSGGSSNNSGGGSSNSSNDSAPSDDDLPF